LENQYYELISCVTLSSYWATTDYGQTIHATSHSPLLRPSVERPLEYKNDQRLSEEKA